VLLGDFIFNASPYYPIKVFWFFFSKKNKEKTKIKNRRFDSKW